jgi:hypothetical protein
VRGVAWGAAVVVVETRTGTETVSEHQRTKLYVKRQQRNKRKAEDVDE